jgi:hypothetical protein
MYGDGEVLAMRLPRHLVRVFYLSLVLCLLSGCPTGPKKYRVTGKLTQGGKPLSVSEPQAGFREVTILFVPDTDDETLRANPQPAIYNFEDGTFVVEGVDGKGIPAGKYRVCVAWYDPRPQDKLGEAYAEGVSPIFREVRGNGALEDIDLVSASR